MVDLCLPVSKKISRGFAARKHTCTLQRTYPGGVLRATHHREAVKLRMKKGTILIINRLLNKNNYVDLLCNRGFAL